MPFITPPDERSLATRNLKRGNSFLLPSGESIARYLGEEEEDIDKVTKCANIKNGTPLWFYILAEAQVIGKKEKGKNHPGEGLGPVGARIVAEVLIGLLELDDSSYLGSNRNWSPTIEDSGTFFMKDLLRIAGSSVPIV